MKHHLSRKLLLELISLAVVSLVIMAGFVFWRLSRGPVSVDFLRPVVQAQFHDRTDMHLSVAHLRIDAQTWDAPVTVRMEDVDIKNEKKAKLLSIAVAQISVSRRGLFTGSIHPVAFDLDKPAFLLDNAPPEPAQAKGGGPKPDSDTNLRRAHDILDELVDPKPFSRFSGWDHLSVGGGSIALQQPSGQLMLVSDLAARLDRTAVGLKGQLHGVPVGQAQGELIGAIELNRGEKGSVSFHSSAIPLSAFGLLPSLADLQKDTVPVEATLAATFGGVELADARLDVILGKGQIVYQPTIPQPVDIAGGKAQLLYQANPEHAELHGLELDLGGPHLTAEGKADTKGGVMTAAIDAAVYALKLDDFPRYWPQDVSRGGRRWVLSNLSKGVVQKATIHAEATAPRKDPAMLDIAAATGTIAVSGANIHYFGELPPVQDANADIVYDTKSMTIAMTGGHAKDFAIKDGTIVLSGFDAPDQAITIDLDLAGPVASALDIINQPPLGYASKVQIVPGNVGGTAETHLKMAFPLLDSLKVDDLGLVSRSLLHDVLIPNAIGHMTASSINGMLYAGMKGMELTGRASLLDIPAAIDYRQDFAKNGPSIATFSGSLDGRQRDELGIDFPDRLKGPVNLSGKYSSQGKDGTVDIDVDMTPADFNIDEIAYQKPPGKPGSAKLGIKLAGGAITAIDPIAVEAPGFSAGGSAGFDPDTNKLSSLTLDHLRADETDMTITMAPMPEGGSKIDLTGSEFDARKFLHKRREKKTTTAAETTPPVPLEVDVDLATVRTSDTKTLAKVKGQLVLMGRKWHRADFSATADGKDILLSYLPDSNDANPSYTLRASASDAGAAFAGFALTDSIKGGIMTIDGKKAAATEQQPDPPLAGTLALTDFSLINPPGFARLFNLLSVSGFGDAVASSDILFDSLKGKFEIDDAELRVSDGKLVGSAIGLTIAGTADRDAGTLDLHGTAVPAYGANRIINKIPVLGPLLTGGDGQGVFAASYSITGPYEKPDVSINPLSVFAPGVLRDLLFTPSDPEMGAPAK